MKKLLTTLILLFTMMWTISAQNDVTFNASEDWKAFMNVFDLPAAGSGYQFGSEWGLADVKSTLDTSANTLVLQPNFNTYADNPSDAYWVDQATGEGNKFMEALTFVEPGETFNGVALSFSGDILSNTLDTNYTASVFIKALDPANGFVDVFGGSKVMELPESGSFSVEASAEELAAGLLVQYGFVVTGVNANPANEEALGNVTIGVATSSASELKAASNEISVSPNPAYDQLNINTTGDIRSYSIMNLTGQLVLKGQAARVIDISSLTSGTYLLNAELGDRRETIKFIKK